MKKVMIVDDDSDLLFMLKNGLKANGYSVTALADGSAALRNIELIRPDIIILDIHMPPWDGRIICLSIKDNPAFRHIPVILYSALPEDKDEVSRCKADRFLQKPLSFQVFIEAIKAMVAA